ncbi:MAG: hypothetical protein KGL42_00450 [Betaproteobacteria bacterium]|nr:hypothetical protein [Betaproteobacteria bacterium]
MKIDLTDFHPAIVEAAKVARLRVDLEILAIMIERCAAQQKYGPPCPRKIVVSAAFCRKRDAKPFGKNAPRGISAIPSDYAENGSDFLENRAVDNADPLEILLAKESVLEKMEQQDWQNQARKSDMREKIFEFTTAELAKKTGLTKRAIQYQRKKLLERIDFEIPSAERLAGDTKNRAASSQYELWG